MRRMAPGLRALRWRADAGLGRALAGLEFGTARNLVRRTLAPLGALRLLREDGRTRLLFAFRRPDAALSLSLFAGAVGQSVEVRVDPTRDIPAVDVETLLAGLVPVARVSLITTLLETWASIFACAATGLCPSHLRTRPRDESASRGDAGGWRGSMARPRWWRAGCRPVVAPPTALHCISPIVSPAFRRRRASGRRTGAVSAASIWRWAMRSRSRRPSFCCRERLARGAPSRMACRSRFAGPLVARQWQGRSGVAGNMPSLSQRKARRRRARRPWNSSFRPHCQRAPSPVARICPRRRSIWRLPPLRACWRAAGCVIPGPRRRPRPYRRGNPRAIDRGPP